MKFTTLRKRPVRAQSAPKSRNSPPTTPEQSRVLDRAFTALSHTAESVSALGKKRPTSADVKDTVHYTPDKLTGAVGSAASAMGHAASALGHAGSSAISAAAHATSAPAKAVGSAMLHPMRTLSNAEQKAIVIQKRVRTWMTKKRLPAEEVDARTARTRWFSPKAGWPLEMEWYKMASAPPLLMPTASDAPALFEARIAPIGELRIEVLEASGLRISDFGSDTPDAYAVIIFEGAAARTNVINNSTAPQWHHESPRAFALPVRFPYSNAYVAIKDDDYPDPDDDLGRVILELGNLVPGTEYDAWYPLQINTLKDVRPGRNGHVRLRVSLTCPSERARLLRYVNPAMPPEMVVPFIKHTHLRDSQFAYRGKAPSTHFAWSIMREYLNEIDAIADKIIDNAIESVCDLLFWRRSAAVQSALVCVSWQLLMSYQRFLSACPFLVCMFYLTSSYVHSIRQPTAAIALRPNAFTLLFSSLAKNRQPEPLQVDALGDAGDASEGGRGNDDGDDNNAKGVLPRLKKRFGIAPRGSLQEIVEHLQEKMDDDVQEMIDDMSEENDSKRGRVAMLLHAFNPLHAAREIRHGEWTNPLELDALAMARALNPLDAFLGPVQAKLGKVMTHLRYAQRLLSWHDRAVTLWLYLALVVLTAVMVLIPWTLVFRLAGLALFGPHMHLVGRRLDKRQAAAIDKELAFERADAKGKHKMVEVARAQIYTAALARVEEARQTLNKRTAAEKERDELIGHGKHNLILRPSRTSSRIKDPSEADPRRSRAYPLPKEEDAMVAVKEEDAMVAVKEEEAMAAVKEEEATAAVKEEEATAAA